MNNTVSRFIYNELLAEHNRLTSENKALRAAAESAMKLLDSPQNAPPRAEAAYGVLDAALNVKLEAKG